MLSPLDPRAPQNLIARVRLRMMYGAAIGLLLGLLASSAVTFAPPAPWQGAVFLGRWILLGGGLGLLWGLWQERSRARAGQSSQQQHSSDSP